MDRGGLHSSWSDKRPHWIVRGVQNSIAQYTFHIYDVEPGGTRPTASGQPEDRLRQLNVSDFQFVEAL